MDIKTNYLQRMTKVAIFVVYDTKKRNSKVWKICDSVYVFAEGCIKYQYVTKQTNGIKTDYIRLLNSIKIWAEEL